MIGRISRAYEAGREDRRAGWAPKTARMRHESAKLHGFYLLGFRDFRWSKKAGFRQLDLDLGQPAS